MGSISGRSGNNGATLGFTFDSTHLDSGVIGVMAQPAAQVNQYPAQRLWPIGWEKFTFQLTGTGTGFSILVYGTIDQQTALGLANEWFVLPGNPIDNGQGQWANPMLSQVNTASALSVKAPLLAVRAVASTAPGGAITGSIKFNVLVVS